MDFTNGFKMVEIKFQGESYNGFYKVSRKGVMTIETRKDVPFKPYDEITVGALMETYMEDEGVQRHARLLEEYEILNFREFMMDEEVAANAVGGGGVDGIGVGPKGEPGVNTLAKWPFPGIGMPSMFRRKAVIRRKKRHAGK